MCWINFDWCEALYLIAFVSTYDSLFNVQLYSFHYDDIVILTQSLFILKSKVNEHDNEFIVIEDYFQGY